MITREVRGLDRLNAKMNAMRSAALSAAQAATKEVALAVAADARNRAPVGRGSQADSSGAVTLRQSISAADDTPTGNSVQSRVVAAAPHAAFVEFGTGAVGAASAKGQGLNPSKAGYSHKNIGGWVYPITINGEKTFRFTRGMPARPFLYPAAKAKESEYRASVQKAVKAAMEAYK